MLKRLFAIFISLFIAVLIWLAVCQFIFMRISWLASFAHVLRAMAILPPVVFAFMLVRLILRGVHYSPVLTIVISSVAIVSAFVVAPFMLCYLIQDCY